MSEEKEHNSNRFVAYEYARVTAGFDAAPLYSDCYKSFGWIPVENREIGIGSVVMKFKRDRGIKNRLDLNGLQKRCENALASIEQLENSKTKRASITALSVGIAGLSFVAGATFSYLGGLIALCVIFAVIGFPICALPYFLYKNIRKKQTAQINPLIDEQYDIVYNACEQANSLLA